METNDSLYASEDFGVHTAREIPVLIPNTEVKPSRGDYTAIAGN